MDVHALARQGMSVSAIARHLGRDRKTIRAYLSGDRVAGQRKPAGPDPFEAFAAYCSARLSEDPHLWATALFDEVLGLGFDRSYPSFTRALRARGLRPACEPCRPTKDRPVAVIDHPAGEECQWDWLELPDPPAHWDGYGARAFLLVGSLRRALTTPPRDDQRRVTKRAATDANNADNHSHDHNPPAGRPQTTAHQPADKRPTAPAADTLRHHPRPTTSYPDPATR